VGCRPRKVRTSLHAMAERVDDVRAAGLVPVINVPGDTQTGHLGGVALSAPMGWWYSGFGSGLSSQQAILVGPRDLDGAEVEHIRSGRVALIEPGRDPGSAASPTGLHEAVVEGEDDRRDRSRRPSLAKM